MYLTQNTVYFAVCSGTSGTPTSPNKGCNAANPTCNAEETSCQCNGEVCDAGTKFCNGNVSPHACEKCVGSDGDVGTGTTQGSCPADLVCNASGGCSGMKWEGLKYIRCIDMNLYQFIKT